MGVPTSNPAYAPLNHFGSGDIPFSLDDHTTLTDAGAAFIQVPFVIGGIAFFHSVPTSYGEIDLDACTLAKIFSRDITRWNHPDIVTLNPGFDLDQPITVVHRVKGSSSTSLSTKYLKTACPDVWTAEGSTIEWHSSTFGAQGSGGVSDYLAAHPYSISYMDSGHGIAAGLSEIALKNANGKFVKSSTDGSISAAATVATDTDRAATTYGDDWSTMSLMNQAGDASWPICTFSYMYIRKNMTAWSAVADAQSAALVKAFALFVLSDEAQLMLPDFGFIPLPADIKAKARAAVTAVVLPGTATPWIFEKYTNEGLDMVTGKTDEDDSINGNGAYVFSSKRKAYADYERSVMVEQIAALEAAMQAMQTAHAALHPSAWYNDPQTEIAGAAAVGALGFILGFIGIVLGAVAMTRIKVLAENSGGGYAI